MIVKTSKAAIVPHLPMAVQPHPTTQAIRPPEVEALTPHLHPATSLPIAHHQQAARHSQAASYLQVAIFPGLEVALKVAVGTLAVVQHIPLNLRTVTHPSTRMFSDTHRRVPHPGEMKPNRYHPCIDQNLLAPSTP
jgi:hypothetical protein